MDGQDHDPRPVFDGDWAKADGHARQAHMTAIAAWKAKNDVQGPTPRASRAARGGTEAQSQAGNGDEERAAHLRTLQAVIDEPGALASDRIRAIEARERILARDAEEKQAEAHGPLVALGDALRALPMEERVGALDGLLGVG